MAIPDKTKGALPTVIAVLRWLLTTALVGGSMTLLFVIAAGRLDYEFAQVLVSIGVFILGGSLLLSDLLFADSTGKRCVAAVGIVMAISAMLISGFLIWSKYQTEAGLWRSWWLCSALAVHIAHVLALLRARTEPRWRLLLRNVTLGAAVSFALILVAMTFRDDVLSRPASPWDIVLGVLGIVQLGGSLALWIWARPRPRAFRLPRRALWTAWWLAVPVCVFAAGFYAGRVSAPQGSVVDPTKGFLSGLSAATIDEQIGDDLRRLRVVSQGLEKLHGEAEGFFARLQARRRVNPVEVFLPEEDDELRGLFFSYLSYRAALLRMVAFYQGFEGVRDPERRRRCFLLGYAAGSICYSVSLTLVSTFADDELVRRKLNEPEPRWGIPSDMFDRIRLSVSSRQNIDLFEEMTAYFELHRKEWQASGLSQENSHFLTHSIEHAVSQVKGNPRFGERERITATIAERVKSDLYSPVYAVQSILSTWIGDTRLVSRPACIRPHQIEVMREQLRPGDILLERRNWYLSNAFLPGFWPHAALYVGTHDDLKALGIAEDPEIRERLEEYLEPAHDGEAKVIIESISEGVSFSSLSESTLADYVAVLRPRLPDDAKARAIVKAFGHQGKPYDFEFDFESSDKLVCTELVYRAYEGALHFELEEVMGRLTLPALNIAKKYRDERNTPAQELEFIYFLDTPAGSDTARVASEESFAASVDRPRAFNE